MMPRDLKSMHVWGLGYGEDGEIVNDMFDVEDEAYVIWNNHVINFYEIYDDSTVVTLQQLR